MTHLPPVLTALDLPIAELSATRLDGEVYAVDGCFSPLDELEQPAHRARSLAAGLHERLIVEQLSAAWVWGALPAPPAQHQFCASIGSRVSRSSVPWRTVREVVIADDDIAAVGPMSVTNALRTAVDILRFAPTFGDTERRAVAGLMQVGGFTSEDCVDRMNARRNLPNKRRALLRLRQIGFQQSDGAWA